MGAQDDIRSQNISEGLRLLARLIAKAQMEKARANDLMEGPLRTCDADISEDADGVSDKPDDEKTDTNVE